MRYIDELQKYDVDFGEADLIGENENVVRIMSIHKSKGLEFPVVFAAGMGKTLTARIQEAVWYCTRNLASVLTIWTENSV